MTAAASLTDPSGGHVSALLVRVEVRAVQRAHRAPAHEVVVLQQVGAPRAAGRRAHVVRQVAHRDLLGVVSSRYTDPTHDASCWLPTWPLVTGAAQ